MNQLTIADSRSLSALHFDLPAQALLVAEQRPQRQQLALPGQPNRHVAVGRITVYVDTIPLLRMTDVVDGHVVMRAPEKRDLIEPLARTEDVSARRLALALRHDPVLHANSLAAVWIRPSRDVARGEDPRHTRLEILIHRDPLIDREAALLGELEPRPHADTDHDEIRLEPRSVVEHDGVAFDPLGSMAEMEHDAGFLMQCSDEAAKVVAEHAPEWNLLGRHDVDVKVSRPQRCRDLESDEASPDHDGAPGLLCRADDRPAVGERAEVVHM